MQEWFDLAKKLDSLVREAAASSGLEDSFTADIRSADPRFGDLQANGALPYAKRNKINPRQIAQAIVEKLQANQELATVADLSIAGPGFINFSLKPDFLQTWLTTFSGSEQLGQAAAHLQKDEVVVVDYSSPNTAKQMHIGHLRSLIIGESICKLLEFCGAKVIRDNHIGDWGTAYGRLFYAYKRFLDEENLRANPLGELERLYKLGSQLASEDEEVVTESREELVKLQGEDPESMKLWETVNTHSIDGIKQVYELFDITFDHYLGESFYRNMVEQIYKELEETGLGEKSEGAWVVFHPEHKRFATQPFMYRKSDGASNYATTDLATMLYRTEHFNASSIIIETDFRQKDHFEQLELTTKKWFEKTGRTFPKFSHVFHGTIMGENGKAMASRSGDPVLLKDLIAEAIQRAGKLIREKNAEKVEKGQAPLSEEDIAAAAKVIGTSSIRYAELSQNRTSDYVFAWDKLLSFEGNTAPYLLYAATRIKSIFRNFEPTELENLASTASTIETAEELALARKILGFVGVLQQTIETLRPHLLCTYLFELAGSYSSFYNANKVIVPEKDIQSRRLMLCQRTLDVLETGLSLLGIPTLERM
ncbi:arginine--tRNA ligase [Pelagicoccus sp. SDUM812002]|uniref:arginine--tRNA ligase n=1 Tax=Pelagicoccus sp. SDUM812002 TaxID=3041266 RepID=UPI00280F9C0A|nr:arginine--tRNA ligase [Pelagicoccus sp. SDUM812002]MDQ8185436.1 arginine--tRNA ligase [Pelagicoccus sp. SDUM812002]